MTGEQGRLAIGICVSLIFNTFILVPGLTADLSGTSDANAGSTAAIAPEFEPEPPEDEMPLGIEESDASTLTWIGYKEFEEHMARLSDMDQAQFQVGGASQGGGGRPEPPAETPTPPTEDTPPTSQPTPETTNAAVPSPDQATATPQEETSAPEKTPPPQEQEPLPEVPSPEAPAPSETTGEKPAEPAPEVAQPEPTEAAKAEPTETKPNPPTPPQPSPQPPAQPSGDSAQQPGPPDVKPGPVSTGTTEDPPVERAADRESDAAATVPVNIKKPGGPVAAQGLTVLTRRPKLTAFEEMQFGQLSIVVRIAFDGSGRPRRIHIGRTDPRTRRMIWEPAERATGYRGRIVSSLFRWRARGPQLEALEENDTIVRTFELVYR